MNKSINKIILLSVMSALVIALSHAEGAFAPLPFLPPGMRFGLGNVLIMYAAIMMPRKYALWLVLLKAAFAFLLRGTMAGTLSLSGGMLSLGVICVLLLFFEEKISYAALGAAGAVTHNIGQIAAISVLGGYNIILYYLPALVIFGIAAGLITGAVLRAVMPALRRITPNENT